MKTFNIFSKLIALAIVFGMCFTSCQKDDALEKQTKKVTFGFNAQIPDNTNKKVDNPEDTDPYYGATSCDFSGLVGATVNVEYTIDGAPYKVNLEILNDPAKDGFVATELIQVELEGDAETITSETLTVTKFNIQIGNDIVMAIPESGSAYDGYVDTPTSFDIKISEYDKKYVDLEVLCFQPDDYLEFGFTWFDFDIVEGEVISVFFNCINSEDREGYHEVLPARIKAYEGVYTSESIAYKDTATFTKGVPLSNYTPVNIEVPGLYKEKSTAATDVVMTLGVTPNGYFEEILIPITKAEVDKYKDVTGEWQTNGRVIYNYSNDNDEISENDIYVYDFVKGDATGEDVEKVIHYQFMDCYKAPYIYSNNGTSSSDIYNVWINGTDAELELLFSVSGDSHIALAPNKRQLMMAIKGQADAITVFDIYSLESNTLTYLDGEDTTPEPYQFTELVYGKNGIDDYQLYATCQMSNEIKLIEIDINQPNGTFKFGTTYNPMPVEENIEFGGGDLLLDDSGILYCFSHSEGGKVYMIDDFTGNSVITEMTLSGSMSNVTGATMMANGNVLTSHNGGVFKEWSISGATITYVGSIDPDSPSTLGWGDLASIYSGK